MSPEELYPHVISTRSTEATLSWARNAFCSTIELAMFGLLFTRLRIATAAYSWACLGGMTLSLGWYFSAHKSRRLMTYWNEKLAEFEVVERNSHLRLFAGNTFHRITRRGNKNRCRDNIPRHFLRPG